MSSSGVRGVFDVDEFDAAVGKGDITGAERESCLAVAAALEPRLAVDDALFAELAWARYDECLARGLPAISDLPVQ